MIYRNCSYSIPLYHDIITSVCKLVSSHEMGRHNVFSSVVCLSVRPSVCLSRLSVRPSRFRVRSISFKLLLQITLHKCQVWWDDVQCLCLTKVGSRSRSQSKVKHCMTVFRVRSISFKLLLQITLHKCQVWLDDVQCLCLTKVGSRSQSRIKHFMTVFRVRSISFEPLVRFTNNCTNVKYDKTMCSAYVWPRSSQGHNLRLNMYDCILSPLFIF